MELKKIDLSDYKEIITKNPKELTDQELLSLDYLLHRIWAHKKNGGRVHLGEKTWSYEDIINLHAFVKTEMSERGFRHTISDELDNETLPFLNKTAIELFNPYHDELGRFASAEGSGTSQPGEMLVVANKIVDKDTKISPEKLKEVIEKQSESIPKDYLEGANVEIRDPGESYKDEKQAKEARKTILGTYSPDSKTITISPYSSKSEHLANRSFIHEVGHHVWHNKLNWMQRVEWVTIEKEGGKRISSYAYQSTHEHFAESFAHYYGTSRTRKYLKAINEPIYNFFEKNCLQKFIDELFELKKAEISVPEKIEILLSSTEFQNNPTIVKVIDKSEPNFILEFIDALVWRGEVTINTLKDFENLETKLSEQIKKNIITIKKEELAPVYPSGLELGREITLEEILPQIKSFYVHPIYAWLVGGLANWGKTKGDIDILWWSTDEIPAYFKKILEFRFGRQFKDSEISKRVQHHLNYFQGPFTKAVPIYALKVERINPEGEIKQAFLNSKDSESIELVWDDEHNGWTIPKNEFEKQLRSANEDYILQAEQSAKEDKAELFRFFIPLKPTRGHKPDEPQSIEAFIRAFKSGDYPVYSSKKFDGADIIIHRAYDRVQIFSEDGNDNTSRFPKLIAALKELPVERFIVLAELEIWKDNKHLPREVVAAYMHSTSKPDDSDCIANIYDIVYFESENVKPGDIHRLPFVDRLKFISELGVNQSTDGVPDVSLKLNLVPHYPCNNESELKEMTEKLRKLPGSEGNVAKKHDFTYNLDNKASGMVKFHNSGVLRAIVTTVNESKTPDVYNYTYALDFKGYKVPEESIKVIEGKRYHEIGTTFSTSVKAKVGDVLIVEYENLNATWVEPDVISITSWVPRVLGISKDNVMSIDEAIKNAKDNYVYQEKLIDEDGNIIYKGVRQAFGSYGGKRFLAHRIASYIPHHRTYVEPFAGGAAVFFAKDPSPREVLNDRDPEIAFMYKFIRDMTPEIKAELMKKNWVQNEKTYRQLQKLEPKNDIERFYKNFYLTRAAYGKKRGETYDWSHEGRKIDFENTIEGAHKRLNRVTIHNNDYSEVLKRYDSPDTFFYMDPPYPGKYNFFSEGFEHEKFLKDIKKLKAKWLISYPIEKADDFKGYNVYRVKRPNNMKGKGEGAKWVTEILVSNFSLEPLYLYIEKDIEPNNVIDIFSMTNDIYLDELEKIQGAFKSPGGKYRMCKKLVRLIPEHKTFVEAFCGGAQVFFHKKPSEIEVINDINPDLVFAYRFIKNMTQDDLKWLEKQNWVISKEHADKLMKKEEKTPRERFYRIAYLNKANYWGRTDVLEGQRNAAQGKEIQIIKRLPEIQERLKNVKILNKDWKEVIKEFDSKDTFFYLDPPYPNHWPSERTEKLKEKFFKEEELLPVLRDIKGKFLLSYELEKTNMFKGFNTYRVKTQWTGSHQLGNRDKYELLVSNFPISESDMYVEKSVYEIEKQDEIFNLNPPEDETYKYVIQSHWRGKSEHKDLRIESVNKDFLIGWTLADLIEDVVNEPVETLESAKRWSDDGSAFKIDFKTGRFKERRTRAGNIVQANIRAFPKAREPHVWLDVEGVTQPFPAPGSTKQYRGVFLIEDKGIAEYGAQKPDVHEYFLEGKLKGRLVIRRLVKEELQEYAKILPPGKIDESPIIDTTMWVAIQPLEQKPIVLTEREVTNKWLPPFGVSALPKAIRKLIPEKYQYWKIEDRSEALKTRDELVKALNSGEVEIDFNQVIIGKTIEKQVQVKVPFVLQYQTFRGPIIVRHGPSKEIWTLRIAISPDRVLAFKLSGDPRKSSELSSTLDIEKTTEYMNIEGEVKPQTYLNPTKETPSYIKITDRGDAVVLIDNEMFKKFEFRGNELKSIWICEKKENKSNLWITRHALKH